MVITVTTTSSTLYDLMSMDQRKLAELNRKESEPYNVYIQNPSDTKLIHIEIGNTATASDYSLVTEYGTLNLKVYDLSEINLISDTSNTDVSILFN